jgi:ABC-type dipeptide/oligopeptide/nickel transport system permease component
VARFITGRIVQAAVTLLAISVLVFLSVRLTGDPALYLLGPEGSQQEYERLVRTMGLDKPILQQYLLFISGIARGDLGTSFISGQPAAKLIAERLPSTLQLAAAAVAIEIALGVSMGVLSAVKRDTAIDRFASAFGLFGMAVPSFWFGIMLIFLFGVVLGWLPTFGNSAGLKSLILPAFVVGWHGAAGMMRLVRASMLEVLDSEYVRFARIKGLSERKVIFKHALRNAMIAPLTFAGLQLAQLLNGTVVAEVVFGWPGIGRLMLEAVSRRDFTVVQATILAATFFFLITSLVVDLLYAYLNPKIRYQGA